MKDSGSNLVDDIQSSPLFQQLDLFGKWALIALLSQCSDDPTPEEQSRYYNSAGQLLSRVLGIGAHPGVVMEEARDNEHRMREETHSALMALLRQGFVDERRRDIGEASEESLQWVFPDEAVEGTLPKWLASGKGLYTISGTEASGKSTLMKYVLTDDRTSKYLEKWAPTPANRLVKASFFFWRNGSRLERSEDGLLRSLLYTVLAQEPQLSPVLFPKEWAALYSQMASDEDLPNPGLGAWRVEQLRDAIRILIKQEFFGHEEMGLKVFFAVDGIDEYQRADGLESFGEILKFFKEEIGTSANAKALISSRPPEEFGLLNITPQITLHERNHGDIATYLRKTLDSDSGFKTAQESNPAHAAAITEYIVGTSSSAGDFLWAVLAIKLVKTELRNGKALQQIFQVISTDPPLKLNGLYHALWSSIPQHVETEASQALRIMLVARDLAPNTSRGEQRDLTLADLTLGLGDAQMAVDLPIMPWSRSEVLVRLRCNQLARSFTTVWPNFITSTSNGGANQSNWHLDSGIRYCHRSVPEFLSSVLRVEPETVSVPGKTFTFCPRIAHLKSAVHQLKITPSPLPKGSWATLWALATTALLAANTIDSSPSAWLPAYPDLLQQLDDTMQAHHASLQKDSNGSFLETTLQDADGIVSRLDRGREAKRIAGMHWSNFHSDPAHHHPRSWESSFLSLAVQFGLHRYVGQQIRERGNAVVKSKKGRPLLDYALYPSGVAPYRLSTARMVDIPIFYGADVNAKFENSTCWERALLWQYETFAVGGAAAIIASGGTTDDARAVAESRAETFKSLALKGVDKWVIVVTSKGGKVTARKVVDDSFKFWTTDETHQKLLDCFPESKSN